MSTETSGPRLRPHFTPQPSRWRTPRDRDQPVPRAARRLLTTRSYPPVRWCRAFWEIIRSL